MLAKYWQLAVAGALVLGVGGYARGCADANGRWEKAQAEGLAKALALDSMVQRLRADSVVSAGRLLARDSAVVLAMHERVQALNERRVALRQVASIQLKTDSLLLALDRKEVVDSAETIALLRVERGRLFDVVVADSIVIHAQDLQIVAERERSSAVEQLWLTAEQKAAALHREIIALTIAHAKPKPWFSRPGFTLPVGLLAGVGAVLLLR